MKSLITVIFLTYLILSPFTYSQQVSDPDFKPVIKNPAYEKGKGSLILIDEAHNNFHTMTGRYKPFADVLENDGYTVKPLADKLIPGALKDAKILVISNALNEKNAEEWVLPTPSAFEKNEINVIEEWVNSGGSLFLIADHMPFPGAAGDLAARFGFELNNGFAFDTAAVVKPDLFTRSDKTLAVNEITDGVDSIYSFTGEAFRIPADAKPVLILNKNFISLMPDTAWNFKEDTKKISVAGLSQGAVREFGKGRVVVWGEAAMFSAQISNDRKVGMNAPYAKSNFQLLLNLIHWLDRHDE